MVKRACLLGLGLSLAPLVAQASIVVALPEPELIARADTIVLGVVLHTRTVTHEPEGVVATQVDLQVYEGLRGALPGDIITLEVPGGTLENGMLAYSAGAPTFRTGEIVFGFLVSRNGVQRPLGLSYGVLRARPDGRGSYLLYRDLSDLILVTSTGQAVDPATTVVDGVPLAEMVARVTRRLQEIGVPTPGRVKP